MKKRILFRFLALFMVVTITTSFISGCKSKSKETSVDKENVETTENNKEETKTNSDSDELIPISFARTTDASVESNIFAQTDESWEDNRWNQLFEDELGVDVVYKWVTTTADQGTQKLNAAIASGDIPDITSVDKTTLKQMAEAGLIIDIAPYFEQYASDRLKKLIEDAGSKSIDAATFGGIQYGLPYVDCDIERADMLWIRQDWLDQAGLEVPQTIDELENVMSAFQEIAGDGAVGMRVNNICNPVGFYNAYGIYPDAWNKASDGTLEYTKATAAMKKPLAKLAEWHAYGLWPLQDSASADTNADWRPFSIIPSTAGETVSPGISLATSLWYVVSASCKNPEKFIEMLNLYCEKSFGDSKEDYATYMNPGGNMEGVWRLSPVSLNSSNKNQVTTGKVMQAMSDGITDSMNGEETNMYNYCKAYLDGDRSLWGWNIEFNAGGSQTVLMEYQKKGNMVYDEFYGAPTETMSTKMSTLEEMLNETIIKIISGQMSVDEYDDTIVAWKKAGGDQIIQEVNEWYTSK